MFDKYLKPMECSFPKIRMGSDGDGGYVIVDNGLENYTGLVAMGICDDNNFEREFQQQSNCYVQQYDYSIDEPPSEIPNSDFFKVKVESEGDIVKSDKLGDRKFLKMDIEGSEWALLPTMDLQQYEQIVCELHFPEFRGGTGLEHLIKHHTIVHVHGNACVPHLFAYYNSNGNYASLPQFLEVTLLRKDMGDFGPNKTYYPTPLDQSCDKGCPCSKECHEGCPCDKGCPDMDLRMYPFVPEI